ncbi:MAG: hypothetical protein Q4A47_06675 [Erysipelotrichaceae bacterium]|nr:hypothetical protein [Erysipelotrichaceae bacterium]
MIEIAKSISKHKKIHEMDVNEICKLDTIKNSKYLKNALQKSEWLVDAVKRLSRICDDKEEINKKFHADTETLNLSFSKYIGGSGKKIKYIRSVNKNRHDSLKEEPLYKQYKEILNNLYICRDQNWLKEYVELNIIMKNIISKNKYFCPICQCKMMTNYQNDHFLPKSLYPTLSISRNNILPVCTECNQRRKRLFPKFPLINPNKINQRFFSNYVEILVNNNFEIDVFPKKNLEKIKNILVIYNIKKRYNFDTTKDILIQKQNEIIEETKKYFLNNFRNLIGKTKDSKKEIIFLKIKEITTNKVNNNQDLSYRDLHIKFIEKYIEVNEDEIICLINYYILKKILYKKH